MRDKEHRVTETLERSLDSTLESVDSAEEIAVGAAQRAGFDEDNLMRIGMAVRESMVNAVVPHAQLEKVALEWAGAVNAKSPMSVRMLKYAFNQADDGLVGQQLFAGEATRLAYMTEEAAEGRDAFLARRPPDWSSFPWYY